MQRSGWLEEIKVLMSREVICVEDIAKAQDLKAKNSPGSLYKFRLCDERSIDCLERGVGYFNVPSRFNDPYDSMWGIGEFSAKEYLEVLGGDCSGLESSGCDSASWSDVAKYYADRSGVSVSEEELVLLGGVVRQSVGRIVEHAERAFNRNMLKVHSVSEDLQSLPMWAHYAADSNCRHVGFAIEYDFRRSSRHLNYLWPVIYGDDFFDAKHVFKRIFKERLGGPVNNLFPVYASLCKASSWSYEREWRLVLIDGDISLGKEVEMPWPTAVYLGMDASDETRRQVLKVGRKVGFPVYQMDMSKGGFRLNPVLLR